MAKFKSNFEEMSFYGPCGNLKQFSEGVYTTDDEKEIAILKKTPYVSLVVKTKEEMKAETDAAKAAAKAAAEEEKAKAAAEAEAAKDAEHSKNPSKFK